MTLIIKTRKRLRFFKCFYSFYSLKEIHTNIELTDRFHKMSTLEMLSNTATQSRLNEHCKSYTSQEYSELITRFLTFSVLAQGMIFSKSISDSVEQ